MSPPGLGASFETSGDDPARLTPVKVLKFTALHAEDHVSPHARQHKKPCGIGVVRVMQVDVIQRCPQGVVVRAGVRLLYQVWLGELEYAAAVRGGGLVVEGPRALVRALPRWLMWSPMAQFVRATARTASGQ